MLTASAMTRAFNHNHNINNSAGHDQNYTASHGATTGGVSWHFSSPLHTQPAVLIPPKISNPYRATFIPPWQRLLIMKVEYSQFVKIAPLRPRRFGGEMRSVRCCAMRADCFSSFTVHLAR